MGGPPPAGHWAAPFPTFCFASLTVCILASGTGKLPISTNSVHKRNSVHRRSAGGASVSNFGPTDEFGAENRAHRRPVRGPALGDGPRPFPGVDGAALFVQGAETSVHDPCLGRVPVFTRWLVEGPRTDPNVALATINDDGIADQGGVARLEALCSTTGSTRLALVTGPMAFGEPWMWRRSRRRLAR